jgi:hypothetical protein
MFGGRIGFAESFVGVIFLAIWVVGWWKIFSRAGYPGLLSLAMFIPIVNVVVFLWLAFLPWPIQDELRERPPLQPSDRDV